jgi:hypothetical protein
MITRLFQKIGISEDRRTCSSLHGRRNSDRRAFRPLHGRNSEQTVLYSIGYEAVATSDERRVSMANGPNWILEELHCSHSSVNGDASKLKKAAVRKEFSGLVFQIESKK